MNCFHMKKWWALKETHSPSKIGLENWNLHLWEESIFLRWVTVSLKMNNFRNHRNTVIDSSQWQVSVFSIFWVIWRIVFLRWVFIGKFSWQTKVSRFKVVFHLSNFFDLTNVSVQVILFPLNLVLRGSLTFFGKESKRRARTMLILLIFALCVTIDISLQWWLLISFSWIFPVERLHSTGKNWLVLIICVVIIISFYHLVSLLEKNRDRYPLAVSQWLCKYICKSSMRTFITIPCNLLKHCLAVHVIISEGTFLELVNSVSNSFECSKFAPGICVIYFSKVLDI